VHKRQTNSQILRVEEEGEEFSYFSKRVSEMDLLTQLQSSLDQTAAFFIDSVAFLQFHATPVPLNSQGPLDNTFRDRSKQFAVEIVKNQQKIDKLIESLPGVNSSDLEQMEDLEKLERSNEEVGENLEDAYNRAQSLLQHVRAAIRLITSEQTELQPPRQTN